MERISPNRLDRGFFQYQEEFEAKALEVLRSGWYVLGKEVKSFEEEFAAYVGAKHCVGLASGLRNGKRFRPGNGDLRTHCFKRCPVLCKGFKLH